MTTKATSANQYINELPADRKEAMIKLRDTIQKNLPAGFKEGMGCGIISFVVPHELYPAGYHCNPELPLPFVSIASHKNFIALYHMGIYASPSTLKWFVAEYPKYCITKLDMGKSCIRFKIPAQIPYKLIGELMKKYTVKEWVKLYEDNLKYSKK